MVVDQESAHAEMGDEEEKDKDSMKKEMAFDLPSLGQEHQDYNRSSYYLFG